MPHIEEVDSSSSDDDDDDSTQSAAAEAQNVLDVQRVDEEPLTLEDFDRFRRICHDLATDHEEECRGRIETIYNWSVVLERSMEEAQKLVTNPNLTIEEYNRQVRGIDGNPVLLRLVKRTIEHLRKTEPNLLKLNVRKLDHLVGAKVYDDIRCPIDLKKLRFERPPIWDQMISVSRHDDRCLDLTRSFLAEFDGSNYVYLMAKYRGDVFRETLRVQKMTKDGGEWDRVMDEAGVKPMQLPSSN